MALQPGQPPDATNAGTPAAGGALSGDIARDYAIKRLKKQQQEGGSPPQGRLTLPSGPPKIRRF